MGKVENGEREGGRDYHCRFALVNSGQIKLDRKREVNENTDRRQRATWSGRSDRKNEREEFDKQQT